MQTTTIERETGRRRTAPRPPRGVSAQPVSRQVPEGDGSTGESLPKPIKVKVEFKLKCPAASSVTVAGDFNDWNPERTPLKKEGNEWKTSIQLERGRYEYRFVVDGKWMDDPEARETIANPFGERNSVFSV